MADNVQVNIPTTAGAVIKTDDLAGAQAQGVKIVLGADSVDDGYVASGNPLPVSAASLPLPSGAATAARQDTGNASVASIDGKTPALGQAAMAASVPVAIASDQSAVPVSAAALPLPSGAATAANQATQITAEQAIQASVEILDDWDESDRAKVNVIAGQAGITAGAGAVAANTPRTTLASDDPAVAGIGATGDAASSAGGTGSLSAKLRLITTQLAGLFTNLNVAHDDADAGNPLKTGGRADTTFQTAVADGDRVNALFDVYGVQNIRDDQPNKWSFHSNGSTALTDQSVQGAPAAGFSIYVTDVVVSLGAATALNAFLEEGSTTILGPYYLEAINGRSIHLRFKTPKKCTAATALTVTTSASVAQALDILGFIAP